MPSVETPLLNCGAADAEATAAASCARASAAAACLVSASGLCRAPLSQLSEKLEGNRSKGRQTLSVCLPAYLLQFSEVQSHACKLLSMYAHQNVNTT